MSETFTSLALKVAQDRLNKLRMEAERVEHKQRVWRERRFEIEADLNAARAEVRRLALPSEPINEGTIVHFEKRYQGNPKRYRYAAIRGAGRWYVTGAVTTGHTWEELITFVRRDNVLTEELPRDVGFGLNPPF